MIKLKRFHFKEKKRGKEKKQKQTKKTKKKTKKQAVPSLVNVLPHVESNIQMSGNVNLTNPSIAGLNHNLFAISLSFLPFLFLFSHSQISTINASFFVSGIDFLYLLKVAFNLKKLDGTISH